MKNNKIIFPLLAALALTGCSLFKSNKNSSSSYGSIISENNYDNDPVNPITSSGDANGYDGDIPSEDPIEAPDEYDSFTGTEIKNAGKYYLKGEYDKIEITASKNSVVYIFLDGVNINCTTGVAFGSSKSITLYLVLLNESDNYIENDYADTNAFHIKGDVHLSGSGFLHVTSKQKNGFKVSNDLFVSTDSQLNLNVEAYGHAITARSIFVENAAIYAKSETKDGIQVECDSDVVEFTKEQGFAYFKDASYIAETHGDGIQADTFVYISNSDIDITTYGEFVSYSVANMETYGLTTDDFKYVKSGDTYKRVAADEIHSLSSSYYALANSVKGIKAGALERDTNSDGVDEVVDGQYDIYIAHLSTIKIDSTDDCIHTNYGDVNIYNSNLQLSTFDDGAHADKELVIEDASIQISNSYEGLEGMNVTINGENTNIVSSSEDDGINAASDLSGTNTITINDGYLRVFANGDGLDANTALYLKGGTVIVEGPGRNNGSLDADSIYFQGGIVFACSSNGMTERMTATQNTFVYQGSSTMSSGSKISIVNSDNNAIFSYTLKQSCNQLIFSHAELQVGSSYRIVSGSTTVSTISMTSSLTKVGNSGGGPGGGPGWH